LSLAKPLRLTLHWPFQAQKKATRITSLLEATRLSISLTLCSLVIEITGIAVFWQSLLVK
jgi:hypothetical protein